MTASDIFAKFDFHCAILQQITHKYICYHVAKINLYVQACKLLSNVFSNRRFIPCALLHVAWPLPIKRFLLNLVGSVIAWTKRKRRKSCCTSEKNIDLGNFCLLFSGMLNLRIYSLTQSYFLHSILMITLQITYLIKYIFI